MRWVMLGVLLVVACEDDRRGGAFDGGPAVDAGIVGGFDAGPLGGGADAGATGGGGGLVGDPCTSDAECTEIEGAMCFRESVGSIRWPGGFCSKACGDEDAPPDECGERAACATVSMAGGGSSVRGMFCSPPCEGDADCRQSEGYSCQMLFGFGFCVPPGA